MRYFIISIFILAGFSACKKDVLPVTTTQDDFFNTDNLRVLIVGSLTWEDPYLPSFSPYHRKDKELENTLLALGVKPENMIALFDEQTTLSNIYAAFDTIAAQSDENTHFLFYFSGHGFPGYGYDSDRQSTYFANYDINTWYPETTGFNVNYIGTDFINKFKGSQILLMADCCQSGSLITQAQQFSERGLKAAAITSCAASNWSTGNWTFTQKIIDGLNGDAFENTDGDGKITFAEMTSDINSAMKNNERQKYASAFFNWDINETVVKTNERMQSIADPDFHAGEYVFAKHKKDYFPVQISSEDKDGKINCRFYNYSDYETWNIDADSIKVPYNARYYVGDVVNINTFKPKTGTIEAVDDAFYEVPDADGHGALWLTYEWLSKDGQQQTSVLNDYGQWVDAKILDSDGNNYFVTYTGKNFQWDEWVDKSRVSF